MLSVVFESLFRNASVSLSKDHSFKHITERQTMNWLDSTNTSCRRLLNNTQDSDYCKIQMTQTITKHKTQTNTHYREDKLQKTDSFTPQKTNSTRLRLLSGNKMKDLITASDCYL